MVTAVLKFLSLRFIVPQHKLPGVTVVYISRYQVTRQQG